MCNSDEDSTDVRNPFRPTSNGGLGNQPDGIENYMDYVLVCHCAFTQGQKDRMRTYLLSLREAILTSHALNEVTTAFNKKEDLRFAIYPVPTKDLLHVSMTDKQELTNVKVYSTRFMLQFF